MEQHYFECQCSDFNHIFRFGLDEVDGEMWLEVNINPYLPWYKRVWEAVRYVFGRRAAYGHYDVTMLCEKDCIRLGTLLDRAIRIKLRRLKASSSPQDKPVLKG